MKQERPIEDYRAAVIALKKQYKSLADEYQILQNEFKKEERKLKSLDIYDIVKIAQKINKNIIKMQSVIRGGIWRKKVKQTRERLQNKNLVISQQEKYLQYVQNDNYELEGTILEADKMLKNQYGMSFIMIFRILDKRQQGSILTDDFEKHLLKYVNLNKDSKQKHEQTLTTEQIKMITQGLDKNKCGYISSDKFLAALEKYGLNEGYTHSVYKKGELNIHVDRAMHKINEVCEFHGQTPEQVFRQLSTNNPLYMSKDAFYQWINESNIQMGNLSKDEVLALNIVFNLEHTQFIKKMDFLSRILPVRRTSSKQTSAKSSLAQIPGSLSNLNIMSRISQTSFQNKNQKIPSQTNIDNEQVQQIIQKMFSNKPLHSFLEMVLLTINQKKTYLTTEDLSYLLDQYLGENNISQREKGLVFRTIDQDGNGNIEMDELVTFFVQMSKKIQVSLQTFLIMQAKLLEVEGEDTYAYFQEIGLDYKIQDKIDLDTFHKTIGSAIGLDEDNINKLFLEIDKKKEGKVSIKEVIQIIDSYRSDGQSLLNKNQEDNLVQQKIKMIEDLKIQLEIKAKLTIPKLWARVDVENKGYVTLYELKTAIQKALPEMKNSQIIKILQFIDINDNSIVDKQEFELAFMSNQNDLIKNRKSFNQIPSTSQIDTSSLIEDKEEVIQILRNALLQNNLTPMKFFEQADTDKSGDISLIELKIILAYLKIDISILLKLMKVFDKNTDGTISYEEFVQEVGENIEPQKPQKQISSLISVKKETIYDQRADLDIKDKLNQYGEEKQYELKEAILSLGKLLITRTQQNGGDRKKAYEELFNEFDVNTDMVLTRAEFIQGLDLYNNELNLTDRQKIRLMITADYNKDNKIDMNEFISFLTESVYKIETLDSESEKGKRIEKFKEKLKQTGGFEVDETAQKELEMEKMNQFLVENLQDILEKKQLDNEDINNIIDKDELNNKIKQIIKLANLEKVDDQLSVNSIRQIFIFNTYQFQLNPDEIDNLMQAFSDQFKGKIIELNLPRRAGSSSRQASQAAINMDSD